MRWGCSGSPAASSRPWCSLAARTSTDSCSPQPYADLSQADEYADDDSLPFQFPLDDASTESSPYSTNFCEGSSGPESSRKYHAAEDYFRSAGTPVYAMADGEISFSGRPDGSSLAPQT